MLTYVTVTKHRVDTAFFVVAFSIDAAFRSGGNIEGASMHTNVGVACDPSLTTKAFCAARFFALRFKSVWIPLQIACAIYAVTTELLRVTTLQIPTFVVHIGVVAEC